MGGLLGNEIDLELVLERVKPDHLHWAVAAKFNEVYFSSKEYLLEHGYEKIALDFFSPIYFHLRKLKKFSGRKAMDTARIDVREIPISYFDDVTGLEDDNFIEEFNIYREKVQSQIKGYDRNKVPRIHRQIDLYQTPSVYLLESRAFYQEEGYMASLGQSRLERITGVKFTDHLMKRLIRGDHPEFLRFQVSNLYDLNAWEFIEEGARKTASYFDFRLNGLEADINVTVTQRSPLHGIVHLDRPIYFRGYESEEHKLQSLPELKPFYSALLPDSI